MKNLLIPIFSLLLVLHGCQKETKLNQNNLNTFTKEDAKAFLRENVGLKTSNLVVPTKLSLARSNTSTVVSSEEVGTLLWNKANEYSYGSANVVEVPYAKKRKTVFLYNFVGNADPDSPQELRAEHSYTNLMVYRKEDGSVEKFFVTYIPDKNSIGLDNNSKISGLNEHFNGFVEYRDWDQNLLFLINVKNGLLYRKFALNAGGSESTLKSSVDIIATASSCTNVCIPVYQVICAGPIESTRTASTETCTVRQIGQNCVQVCSDNPSPNDPPFPPPPGTGGEPNNNGNIQQTFNEIFDIPNSCPNASAQAGALATAFAEMTNPAWFNRYSRCMTMKIINAIRTSNPAERIKICMDANVPQASYRANERTIRFNNATNINADNLLHELFHVLQDKKYLNGIHQYQDPIANPQLRGYSDIEFERNFFQDLMNAATNFNLPSASSSPQYENFIKGLTQGGNLNNAKNYISGGSFLAYFNYLIEFKEQRAGTVYDKPHALLTPKALEFLFQDSNCINLPAN